MQKYINYLSKMTIACLAVSLFAALFLIYQIIYVRKKMIELIELRTEYRLMIEQIQEDKKKNE